MKLSSPRSSMKKKQVDYLELDSSDSLQSMLCRAAREGINERPSSTAKDLITNGTISSLDILCGRGKAHWNHQGNALFRKIIRDSTPAYKALKKRGTKIDMIKTILGDLTQSGARFLKNRQGKWIEMDTKEAREKVAHSLRDQVASTAKGKITLASRNSSTVTLSTSSSSSASQATSTYQGYTTHAFTNAYECFDWPDALDINDFSKTESPLDFDLTSLQADFVISEASNTEKI